MKIDLSCPVELWQYQLPAGNEKTCTFLLGNLSDKTVVSVQVALLCYDSDAKLLYRQVERVQGLSAAPSERFSILLLPTKWEGVSSVDLLIEKVWFDDAVIWRRGSNPLTEYEPNALKPGRKLDTLRFVAGQDAVGYPSLQQSVWVCVCGRANPRASTRCCRCDRPKDTVFASFTQPNIEQLNAIHEQRLDEQARKALSDASKLESERQKRLEFKKKKRKRALRALLASAGVLLLAAAVVFWALPLIRYTVAKNQLSSGQYDEAKAAFAQMGAYQDAEALVPECDYQKALSALDSGDTERLTAAAEGFEALGAYKDSSSRLPDARYQLALSLLSAGRYDEAFAAFALVPDHEGASEGVLAAKYGKAGELLAQGAYQEALDGYLALADYQDSAEKATESRYQLALTLLEKDDKEQAAVLFEQLGDYQESRPLYQDTCYRLAQSYELADDFEKAGQYYLKAGDYEDSAQRARVTMYQVGVTRREAGAYDSAAEAFYAVADYEDATKQGDECVYLAASALEAAQEYDRAREKYLTIPDEQDASTRAKQCQYLQATLDLNNGDNEKAEAALLSLGDYADAPSLLKRARYRIAIGRMASGDYDGAKTLLSALGSYEDSQKQLKECDYRLALGLLDSGDHQGAVTALTALGSYSDSKSKLAEARAALGQQLLDTGDALGAAEQTALLSQGDAQTALGEQVMAKADALLKQGELAKADAIYEALGDYGSAQDKRKACQYQAALLQKDAGELKAAAQAFAALGRYEDAASQSQSCYDALYGDLLTSVQASHQQGDYLHVVEALREKDLSDLPRNYRTLKTLYEESAYRYAESLYDQGLQYEALPYYQLIPDYEDVSTKKLKRRCYLILGTWQTESGGLAQFGTDYTCELLGEKLYFKVDNYVLRTGLSPDALADTHKLTSINATSLTLRDLRNGKNLVSKFTHSASVEVVAPPASPASEGQSDAQ